MGYSFYIISKEKEISQVDFDKAMASLSEFNQKGLGGRPPCDIDLRKNYIYISGSFTISGQYAENFVLNLSQRLTELGYKAKTISSDWKLGNREDWDWLDKFGS